MRELSFRIWDKKEKTMFLSPIEIEHLGSWFDAHLPGAIADTGNKIVMQYTGLKDKNGTEIYEGDILERESYKHEDVCVIKWDEFRCGFIIDYVYFDESYDMNELWDDFIIIGNIHDNPKLLVEEMK